MTPDDVLDLLGIEISPARLKCALLSLETLAHAIAEGGRRRDGAASRARPRRRRGRARPRAAGGG